MSSQKKSPALLALEAAKATKVNREMRLNRKTIPFVHRRGSYEQAIEEYAEFDLSDLRVKPRRSGRGCKRGRRSLPCH